ncbi:hypothetical protein QQF73_03375 [Marinobacter sp. M216]|uniref:Uncharacterized protein n=1 Tax=Marinobacter albus TaxID=3030833 RepID=A0ABT7H8H3_9GAMM|nr:hypothetical protein [Marinobacter sp. M216]MDK9556653.1 hypothetical protein [Marinobacter sp. M216]
MNENLLALVLLNDPNYTLQSNFQEDSESESDPSQSSFELLSEEGELVGYVKTWQEEDDFAGFVHFDADGNILDWKVFSKAHPSELPKTAWSRTRPRL